LDDSIGAMSDLALDDGNNDGGGEKAGNAAAVAAGGGEEQDPWAVLAAAAGEEAPAPSPPAPPASSPPADAVDGAVATAVAVEAPPVTVAHAEGETFAMPGANDDGKPSLVAQIQSSTADLSAVLSSKVQEIDAKTGISTRAKTVDEQYHITEKWSEFQNNVIKPTTAKTVERTKEVTAGVKEKVAPPLAEGWGSIKQRSTEMGITQKWSSISSKVGSKWNETREQVGGSVEQWKEEQERKRAAVNLEGGGGAAGGGGLPLDLEGTKEKVVESWTGGVNWVSQRLRDAKLSAEVDAPPTGALVPDSELRRLDTDGLPTSFRRDM